MVSISEIKAGIEVLKDRFKAYEYEIILIGFLLLRFVFKNILNLSDYFTKQAVFGLSDKLCIVIGVAVLIAVCVCLSLIFGRLIKRSGPNFEKPLIIFVAFFFACPATLPFLFNTHSISGTQLLYPFALFIISICLIGKKFVEWLVPFICVLYFIPALYTKEVFFTVLRKAAILYVSLILLFLFLDMMKKRIELGKRYKKLNTDSVVLLAVSLFVSVTSYIYALFSGKSYYESLYNESQRINGYLLVCLLIVAPLLVTFGAGLSFAVKNRFIMQVFGVFWRSQILLFLLFRGNYYGLWIPFLTISLSSIVFYNIWNKSPEMLLAVRKVAEYFLERRLIFYVILMAMASLSNVSSDYLSNTFKNVCNELPF